MSQAQNPTSNATTSAHVELRSLTSPAVETTPPQLQPQSQHDQSAPATAEPANTTLFSTNAPPEPQVAPQTVEAGAWEPAPIAMPQPALLRTDTVEAIGPSTDLPTPMLPTGDSANQDGHVIIINLLLTSTGTRHPYKIDERYLTKRNVSAQGPDGLFDPFVISVYTLKELIWRDWREGTPLPMRLVPTM